MQDQQPSDVYGFHIAMAVRKQERKTGAENLKDLSSIHRISFKKLGDARICVLGIVGNINNNQNSDAKQATSCQQSLLGV